MELIEKIDNRALTVIVDNFDHLFDNGKLGRFVLPSKNYSEITDKKTILTTLKNLLRSKKTPSPKVAYKYSRGMEGSGRKFAEGASLQTISRVIRHTVARDIYWDLDIVNCHPCILLKYCEDNNLKCDSIRDYIQNRDKYIKRLVGKYKDLDPDGVKKIYLSLINGASRYQKYPEKDILLFEMEMKNIMSHFIKTDEGNALYKKAYDKKKTKTAKDETLFNVEGSAINLYFCQIENILLESLCKYLVEMNYKIGTYCFDGVLIYKDSNLNLDEDILLKLEKCVLQDTGFNVSLKQKEMSEGIDLTGLKTSEEKDLELTEMGVALFAFEYFKNIVKYDQIEDKLYLCNSTTSLWGVSRFDVLKNRIYKLTVDYCTSRDIEISKKLSNRIQTSSWFCQVQKQIVSLIYENMEDSLFIKKNFNKMRGFIPIANNKIMNLETLEVRDIKPTDYFTKTTDNIFTRDFRKQEIDDYLKELLMTDNQDYVDYLLLCIAYSFTGENNLKRLYILCGEKNGGKSLFINLLISIFQEFGGYINDRVFKQSRSESVHNTEVFSLTEKRMGNVSELEEKDHFNECLLKKITGADPLNIRACGSNVNTEVEVDTVLWLSTNEIPKFSDDAFCSRLRVFLFKNKFSFNQVKKDHILGLKDDLFSYICVMGKRFYENGKSMVDPPEVVTQTQDVINSKNSALQFFNDTFEVTKSSQDRVGKSGVYKMYADYCKEFSLECMGRNKFYSSITNIFSLKTVSDRYFTNIITRKVDSYDICN